MQYGEKAIIWAKVKHWNWKYDVVTSCMADEIKRKWGQNGCVERGQEIYLAIRIIGKGTLLNISKAKMYQCSIGKWVIKSVIASKNAQDLVTRIQLVTRMGIQHVSVVLSWSNCIIFVAALKATLIDATQRFLNEFKMQFAQFLGCSHICICNEKSWLVGVWVLKAPLREPTADLTINMFLDLLATSTNNIWFKDVSVSKDLRFFSTHCCFHKCGSSGNYELVSFVFLFNGSQLLNWTPNHMINWLT